MWSNGFFCFLQDDEKKEKNSYKRYYIVDEENLHILVKFKIYLSIK